LTLNADHQTTTEKAKTKSRGFLKQQNKIDDIPRQLVRQLWTIRGHG